MRSYLIHNFKKRSCVYRWTPKRNLNWLLSNLPVLYIMSVQLLFGEWRTLLNLTTNHNMQVLFKYVFSQSMLHKTNSSLVFKNHPVGNRSFNSLKYGALRLALGFFDNVPSPMLLPARSIEFHHNRYHNSTPFLLTRATKKILRASLFKFLTLTTLTWVQWSRLHRFTQQHTYLPYDFYFLKFLNVYFFKVFNF